MKAILFIIFFLSFYVSFSQTQTFASIPEDGILLNEHWKYQEGDNPEWADAKLNDEQWKPVDPTKDIHDLPMLWQKKIVWFRLHFSLDSSLNKQALALLIEQTGASEIYLNGRLLSRYGKLNNGPNVIAATPHSYEFLGINNDISGEYILAIRFAVQQHLPYLVFAGRLNTALTIHLMGMKAITKQINSDNTFMEYLRTGIYLILTVLHLALFCFYPKQRGNLFFFLYAFLFTCLSILNPFIYKYVEFADTKMYCLIAIFSMFLVSLFFFLTAIYAIFNFKAGFVYWALACFLVLSYVLFFTNYYNGFIPGLTIFPILVFLESARVAILALKSNKRGAKIIISGAICFIIFFSLHWLIVFNILPAGSNWIFEDTTFFLSFLSLPIAASIFLALESTFATQSLKEKLIEVQILSDKTLVQEQEKKQILATENERLEKQVTGRTAELRKSLEELKSTQSQLIQSEKMASLGELTAGIAHEIQNPLNFVNNFSEVNTELIAELQEEIDKGNISEVKAIANDIADNEQKINHHGKRAGAIVKGMLQHSRTSSGKKEPTNINALCDEYLRLSYHGLRAKDKDFNATMKTDFDESIGKINIVPQDIGRAILNLINNAFYAVAEKKKMQIENYEPIVSVSTKKVGDKIQISVKDNGNGISQKIVDKIFQPFFTTKPTGQGTGLGLSLSYDIVKAHGGEIKVETVEGKGSEFIIQIPIYS